MEKDFTFRYSSDELPDPPPPNDKNVKGDGDNTEKKVINNNH